MERIWASLSPLTEFAIVLIAIVGLTFHIRWSRRGVALGPTLLTTLGIFFCFTGIAWGLLSFDPNDVRASVPQLLQGIRTSFWASVAGIGFALTIKARHLVFGDVFGAADGESGGASVDDLVDRLDRLHKSVTGTDEGSLVGQITLLRNGANTRLDRLTASFEKYAERVAESNSKALIQALQEVIRDFNAKINEQFGENFKQLNAAVGRLLDWQIRYEEQLNALIEQETATRKNMTTASLRYADLVNRSTVFTEVAQQLAGIVGALQSQAQHLEGSLTALAQLIDKAAGGLPEIERKIVEMTAQIESGVRINQDRLANAFEASSQAAETHTRELTQMLTASIQSSHDSLNHHLRQSTEESKKHVQVLDKALEEELRRSIESLGRQLTALSQKFVQDYTPLTAQLQRVLQTARPS